MRLATSSRWALRRISTAIRSLIPHRPRRGRVDYLAEPLERRVLLSITLAGIPNWVEQGPGPMSNAGTGAEGLAAGAINGIAADPANANRLFVASVNGGVWRTTNAYAANPTWVPLTDQFPSLSMGSITMSPLDSNTLFAGFARVSSGAGAGGPLNGILKTTDGGSSWVQQTSLSGQNVFTIVPTSIGSGASQVVLVRASNGIFRSVNGGTSYGAGNAPVLSGDASSGDLLADPANSFRFYAAIPGQGVFKSTDGGANWSPDNGNIPVGLITTSTKIQLAVHQIGASNGLYAAIANPGAQVYRSSNQGGAWIAMDVPPDAVNYNRGFVADPITPNVVFINGSAEHVYRGDAGVNPGFQWTLVTGSNANNTVPHVDHRDFKFDANNNLLGADDGGIYRLVNPNGTPTTRTWHSVDGNIRSAELNSVAYDSLNNTIFSGAWDNGTSRQRANSDPQYPFDWQTLQGGDGGIVGVNNDQTIHPGTTIQYTCWQGLGAWTRRTVNSVNSETSEYVNVHLYGAPANIGFDTNDNTFDFIQPYVLNSVVPSRIMVGTQYLYESLSQQGDFHSLGGTDANFRPQNPVGQTKSLVYGGRFGGAALPDVAYIGTTGGTVNGVSGILFRRSNISTPSNPTLADFTTLTSYQGGIPRDIVLDPDNWQRGFVVDFSSRVWRFINGGTNPSDWTDITGNLGALSSELCTIELYTPTSAAGDDFVLVGGLGGVFRILDPSAGANTVWTEFGANIPNAITTDLHYNVTDNVLVAGTFGRGAWTIPNAAASIVQSAVLTINGDTSFAGQPDTIRLIRNANNPLLLDAFLNNSTATADLSVPMTSVTQIVVNGLGGDDSLTVDLSNGNALPPGGITYTGGTGSNSLIVNGTINADTMTLGNTLSVPGGVISYSGVSSINLQGSDGNDTFNIGDGDIQANIHTGCVINLYGQAGNDTVNLNDASDLSNDYQYLIEANSALKQSPGGATTVSGTINYDTHEFLSFNAGNNRQFVRCDTSASGVATTINCNGGNDEVWLGWNGGNLGDVAGAVSVNGGGGSDTVTLWDDLNAGNNNYSITNSDVTRNSFGGLTYSAIEGLQLMADQGSNAIKINSTASGVPVTVNAGGGTDSIIVYETDPTAPVTFAPSSGDDTVNVNTDNTGSATALFAATQRIGPLSIGSGGLAQITAGGNKVLTVTGLSIPGTGKLDLTDEDMIVDYSGGSQLSSTETLIRTARNGGAWTGSGITSTSAQNNVNHNTTLGAIEATSFKSVYGQSAQFDGQTIDNTAVLIKYTYYGDTDFNGKVDGADYGRIDARFNQQGTGSIGGWFNGDLDYNGKIDGADYALIDAAFNSQSAALRPGASLLPPPRTGTPMRRNVAHV